MLKTFGVTIVASIAMGVILASDHVNAVGVIAIVFLAITLIEISYLVANLYLIQ
jgi:hypothetical protein